jgi:16S rRNA processing protein RimM
MSVDKGQPAGPPSAGGPAFLIVGKIHRPHGVHGEVKAEIHNDYYGRLCPKKVVYIGEQHHKLVVTSQRPYKDGLLIGFEGVTTPEQAGRYRNQILSISASEIDEHPEGEFYIYELLGLEVKDEKGSLLGTLTEIIKTGANDVYVVNDASRHEILIPAIPGVILHVDLEAKIMKVHLLPGLVDQLGCNS